MASYFGSVRPAQAYRAKIRWLLGCLSSLIMVLVGALVYVVSLSDADIADSNTNNSNFAHASSVSHVEVLIPNQRIELGDRLDQTLFRRDSIPLDAVPLGAVQAKEASLVWGKFADGIIMANHPLLHSDLANRAHPGDLPIPPGYRAKTIRLGQSEVVAGYVGPNKRVDVMLVYKDPRGIKTVDTIIEFAKVLSFNGGTSPGPKSTKAKKHNTVTLLVTQRDAQRLELAKDVGRLTLSLRSDLGTGEKKTDVGPIQLPDVIKVHVEEDRDPNINGTIYYSDPRTGQQIRRQLVNRKWKRAEKMSLR